jgi:DNA-binding response OmpR family regulator
MAKRILYLEDEATTRTAMAYVLRQEGYEVISHPNAEEALPHIAAGDVDIALLDVRLPGRFGDDFGRELAEKSPKVQIIFLTAEEDIDRIKQLVPSSMTIRKPVDIAVLLEILRCHDAAKPAQEDAPPQNLPFPNQAS